MKKRPNPATAHTQSRQRGAQTTSRSSALVRGRSTQFIANPCRWPQRPCPKRGYISTIFPPENIPGQLLILLTLGLIKQSNTLRVAHNDQNRGQGVTKAQYVQATMAFMEKEDTFVKMYTQWLDKAANIHLEDGSKQVCRLTQTCTPTGAARKYLTTITDVFLMNYAVSLDEARDGTQKNTQGRWPCKLPIDSLPLQQLASSPELMSSLS